MIKTSKNNPSDRLLPQLQKSKDEVRSFLLGKIQEGEEKFLKPIVSNQEKLDQIQDDYASWKSYNEEYLKRVFTTDEISYEYSRSPYPLDVINHFRANALSNIVKNFKKEVKNNIGILEQILAKLDLYEMQETTNLGGQENRGQKSGESYNITVGNNSHVNIHSTDHSINTVSIDNQDLDMVVLAEELGRLRKALLPHAESAEQYVLVGQIASAETVAKTKNTSDLKQILSKLGPSAKWVLNIAKAIGVPITIKALEAYIKL